MKHVTSAVSVIIDPPGILRESDHKELRTGSREDLMKRRDGSEMEFFFKKFKDFKQGWKGIFGHERTDWLN